MNLSVRPARTTIATIAAAILLAAGVLGTWLAIDYFWHGQWSETALTVGTYADPPPWGNVTAMIIAGAAGVLGLVLVLCGILPGGRKAVDFSLPDDPTASAAPTHIVLTTKGLASLAAAEAMHIDGVLSVNATASANVVSLALDTPLRNAKPIVEEVHEAVTTRLSGVGLHRLPRVHVWARFKEMS